MNTKGTDPAAWMPGITFLLPVALAFLWVSTGGYQGLNGQDAHDYLHISWNWTAWWHGGPLPVMVEHPHGYPLAGAMLGTLIGDELPALRILSAISLVFLALLVRSVLKRGSTVGGRGLDSYVLLAVVLSPFLLRYALTVMSDVSAMALLMAAFLCLQRWDQERRTRWLAAGLVPLALALSVRLAAAPFVAVLLAAAVFRITKPPMRRWLFVGAAALASLIGIALVLSGTTWNALVQDSPLADWSVRNFLARELHSDDGVLRYRWPNIPYVLGLFVHPGFLPIGPLLLPFLRRGDLQDRTVLIAFTLITVHLLFMAGMPFQNDRVLLIGQPFVVILFAPAFARALAWCKARSMWKGILALSVMVQVALVHRAVRPFIHQAEVEREVAAVVREYATGRVFTHGMGAALVTYCPGTVVTELWYAELDGFPSGALLVVHPGNLRDQWQGRPPGINWDKARAQGVERLWRNAEGWEVLRLKGPPAEPNGLETGGQTQAQRSSRRQRKGWRQSEGEVRAHVEAHEIGIDRGIHDVQDVDGAQGHVAPFQPTPVLLRGVQQA